ncbi:glycosyltransferase [Halobacteriaceae archaeon GCM10025711]
MKVLQLVTTPSSFFTKQVAALDERGVESTVVTVPGSGHAGRSPGDYLQFYREVLGAAVDDYDVVHANYGLTGLFALAQPRRPVVLTLWGSEVMGHAGWLDTASRRAARHADAVIAPSETLASALDVDHTVVPFGVDTELFRPIPRADARAELGWDDDETVVLFPYSPDRQVKNHPLAERVVDAVPHDARLQTISQVPYEQMPYYMNASDAVLVTSRRESGPMVVKEAAACNVPVVTTDVGFTREVLGDVTNSHVAASERDLVDGLATVLDGDGRSDGRTVVDATTLDQMGDRIRGVYDRVLDGRAG